MDVGRGEERIVHHLQTGKLVSVAGTNIRLPLVLQAIVVFNPRKWGRAENGFYEDFC